MKLKHYNVGLIGLGDIAGQYLDTLKHVPNITVTAAATRHPADIEQKAKRYSIPKTDLP